ncbi:MAG: TRIC cation channel family protein [Actinomycetia bacterium]|nr:TRIC cation channel family protein [Actinomycetes bacterium]
MTGSTIQDAIFLGLEVIGTVVFALSGVMAAARSSMDWLGGMVLGLVVAVGGGTIRDLVIGETPVNWVEDPWPLAVAAITAVVLTAFLSWRPITDIDNWGPVLLLDAVGLAVFVVLGAGVTLRAGVPWYMAILLGVVTGVGGGVIRDLLTDQKPAVLVGPIYALAGFAGSALYVILIELGLFTRFAIWLPIALVIVLRVLAIRGNWHLPLLATSIVPKRQS